MVSTSLSELSHNPRSCSDAISRQHSNEVLGFPSSVPYTNVFVVFGVQRQFPEAVDLFADEFAPFDFAGIYGSDGTHD